MIKMQAIGHLGRDAEVNIHGTKTVINFSIAHTEKYKDQNGTMINKTVWVKCAWWTDKTAIAQYLKKGTQVYAEGQPGVNMWRDNSSGENKSELTMRIHSVQLLGGKKEENDSSTHQSNKQTSQIDNPVSVDNSLNEVDDLPF